MRYGASPNYKQVNWLGNLPKVMGLINSRTCLINKTNNKESVKQAKKDLNFSKTLVLFHLSQGLT
jgi:hypothetical protein